MTAARSLLPRDGHDHADRALERLCAAAELEDATAHGASGATSNPVLVLDALRLEPEPWERRMGGRVRVSRPRCRPRATRRSHGGSPRRWPFAVRSCSSRSSNAPRADEDACRSRSTPRRHRDTEAMLEQATRFHQLAPNIQVKLPVTTAGLAAIEEATARGIPINATVNTTVAGALAVGEAVERGLERRSASAWTSTPSTGLHADDRPARGLAEGRQRP